MNLRAVRQYCLRLVDQLPIPIPFDLEAFIAAVAVQRHKAIHLAAYPLSGDLYGVWVPTPRRDYIFFERNTSRSHQEQIILHEIAHLLCNHRAALVTVSALADLLPDGLRTHARAMRGGGYDAVEEQEAECLASLIRQHATTPRAISAASDVAATPILTLLDSLEGTARG